MAIDVKRIGRVPGDLHPFAHLLPWFFEQLFFILVQSPFRCADKIMHRGIALAHLGQARFAGLFRQMEQREVAEEIGEAIERLSRSGIGAIVAIEREVPLDGYSESGSPVEAKVSADLLTTIFTPYSPLHDGAVLVRGDTIIAAGCILPLSQKSMIDRTLGTRHRAALGLSDETDALVVVVSEERATISVAERGELFLDLTPAAVRDMLAGRAPHAVLPTAGVPA